MKKIDWVERANKAKRRGDPNETERLLDHAIRKNPDNREAWTLLMEVAYEKQEPLKFLRKLNAAPLSSRAERRELELTFHDYIAERDRAEQRVIVRLNAEGKAIPVTGLQQTPARHSFLYTVNLLLLFTLMGVMFAAQTHVWLAIGLLAAAVLVALGACFYRLIVQKERLDLAVLVTVALGLSIMGILAYIFLKIPLK
jgi:hypothetical protein